MKQLLISMLVVGMVPFVGCGGSALPPNGPGTYTYKSTSGTSFTLEIPTRTTPAIKEVEAFRRQVQAHWRRRCANPPCGQTDPLNPVSYAALQVDNSKGSGPVEAGEVSVVTPGGRTVPLKSAPDQVFAWGDQLRSNITIHNGAVALSKKLATKTILPGTKATELLIVPKDVAISRILLSKVSMTALTPVQMERTR